MTLAELITDLKAAGANKNTIKLALNCYELGKAEAQSNQEPVAWITQGGKGWLRWHKSYDDNKDSIPLYKAPPQREHIQFPTMLRRMWSGGDVQDWLDTHVNGGQHERH